MEKKQFTFGPFRLDEANECVWRDGKSIQLRPKAYTILKYLLERPNILVTKQQLLDDIWSDTFVTDAVLKDCVSQLREALGDDAKAPQFIETAHRRGYRFIAEVEQVMLQAAASQFSDTSITQPRFAACPKAATPSPTSVTILGREDALALMHRWLEESRETSQLVFVTGEAGIGKTTLVEAFLEQLRTQNLLIARGQCMEQYGAGEAYLPLFDSFSRLARAYGPEVINVLRRHAPSWLVQMPGIASETERESIRQQNQGVTRERMLREIGEAIEALSATTPLILVLEDLHWCDYSTLDLLSYLARRRQAARLLLIGTYRPVEVIVTEHPIRNVQRELQLHKLCHELPLDYLTEEAIADFIDLRFPGHQLPRRLATMIHQRTEGNPLFMVNVVEYLIDEKIIADVENAWRLRGDLDQIELGVPESVQHMIEKHIERLTAEEQRVLEGASVVGMDCSAVAISAGLAEDVVHIEEVCDRVARRYHFLMPAYLAELPDGTITPRYRFMHSLYLNVLYRRIAPTRRSQIHGRIGARGEAIYGDRVGEIAAELAVHFEQSRDLSRAVKYLQMAAENATQRSADHEGLALAKHGFDLLKFLPDSAEKEERQSRLREQIDRSLSAHC
jgi:predicted ATPase/DNA-binding winged helix-turn-helix (wHTH) protein